MKKLKSFLVKFWPLLGPMLCLCLWSGFAVIIIRDINLPDPDQLSLLEEAILAVGCLCGFCWACVWSASRALANILYPFMLKLFPKRKKSGGADNA